MRRNLVFHMYIDGRLKYFPVNILHLVLLKENLKCFDNVYMFLAYNEIDECMRQKVEIIKNYLGHSNITYKEIINNSFIREGITFYKEFICKLDQYDGITMFAHSKGITNMISHTFSCTEETIYNWIIGMYFQCFYNVDEIERNLKEDYLVSGAYHVNETTLPWRYKYRYQGSFCWYNTKRLLNYLENLDPLYYPIDWRKWFKEKRNMTIGAEDFLQNYVDIKQCHYLFKTLIYDDGNKYNQYISNNTLYATMTESQIKEYEIYKQNILEQYERLKSEIIK